MKVNEKKSSPLHGSMIAKITLSKILKMRLEKYTAFIERKLNGAEGQHGKRPSFYAKVIPTNGDLRLEMADERLLKRYPNPETNSSASRIVVKMINTRNELSEHIVRGILEFQRTFWETGKESDIKPLMLQQFLSLFPCPGLDASRLSRLVSALRLQTQYGRIVSMRRLFISRRRFFASSIKSVIDDSDESLTDKDIQTVLQKRCDICLSVRTVCECRKLLSIPNFRERHACYYPRGISFSKPLVLRSKDFHRIPTEPGVYELCVSLKTHYPKCSGHVIYIGSSKNLRRRTADYTGRVLKNKLIADFLLSDNVCIRYHVTRNYIRLEKELLKNFKQHYGRLPKGNIIGAKL